MSTQETAVAAESTKDKVARLRKEAAAREEARTLKYLEREADRLELVAKYEAELGPEGSEFFVYDSGHLSDPLFVVKRGLLVQFTTYEQSKHTPTDRFDFVSPSVVFPAKDVYLTAREARVGVEVELANRLAKLFGLNVEVERGK